MAIKLPKKPAAGDPIAAIVTRIKERKETFAIETGKDLIEAKALVQHGQWGQWLKDNFDWSQSTAQGFMNAAKLVAKIPEVGNLKPSAAVALAAKNVPETVKSEVIADLKAGKKPSPKEVKAKIAAAKPKTEPKAKPKLTVVAQTVQAPVPAHVPEPKVAALFPALNEPTPGLDILQAADALKALGIDKAVEAFNVAFPGVHLALEMAGPSEPLLLEATA